MGRFRMTRRQTSFIVGSSIVVSWPEAMNESAELTNFGERVMGTNRDALQQVIEHLKNEARAGERQTLTLFRNEDAGKRQLLPQK
jgi:hypothetical protein